MGVRYTAILLDEAAKRWLREKGVSYPDTGTPSRWPTPNELRSTLESLPGYSVTYTKNSQGGWDAEIVDAQQGYAGWFASIWTKNVVDDDQPNEFTFYKSRVELVLVILEKLSHDCGLFVMVDDSSFTPVVVARGSDLAVLAVPYL